MAAVSTPASTFCILSHKQNTFSLSKNSSPCIFLSRSSTIHDLALRRSVRVKGSSDEADTATDSTGETEMETPIDVIEAENNRYSLISALNVERAIRGIPITDVDHYGRLGIPMGSAYEQVTIAYKRKLDELMNQKLEADELSQKLELLKESHGILSIPEERRLYDWSLARNEKTNTYSWPFEVDLTQSPPILQEPPPVQLPENEEPTRLLGYFILAWLVLSFILSSGLNR
ncbi:NAD(P)H-quinone oxidoreductase subunit U, chloroplastic [Impatiens glandulifera]|uniref:NAD(P)H-quinone oxidoreductase subunit U, chloroplastic n=1 Tax=Impatiens glandulifera TaxID=253017 RepID=UPI001FB0AC74|nr:NAD(P)H-quinone oxidoreductase subunit U, chloroplastic [Impatiens glandulifera]